MRLPLLATLCIPLWTSAQEGPTPVDIGLYMQGRAVFEQQCAPCHGRSGRGNGDWAADVADKPRNFRSGIFKFRTTPLGFLPTTADLERTLRTGVSGTMMPAFTHLSDHDLKAVLSYVRSFSSKWKDPEKYHASIPTPEPPDWFADSNKKQQQAQLAEPLFKAACSICHGSNGKGDGPGAASLIDAWKQPSRPADFTKPHRKSGPKPQDLYRTIAHGLDGTPMTAYDKILPEETIWAMVAYLQSLAQPISPQ